MSASAVSGAGLAVSAEPGSVVTAGLSSAWSVESDELSQAANSPSMARKRIECLKGIMTAPVVGFRVRINSVIVGGVGRFASAGAWLTRGITAAAHYTGGTVVEQRADMDWRGRRQSRNIEDRRGQPLQGSGGGAGLPVLFRLPPWLLRSRVGRVVLAVGVMAFVGARLLGIDLLQLTSAPGQQTASFSAEEQQLAEFVSVVLADTEHTWQAIFAEQGMSYEEPVLVLFSQRVASACGTASSAVGPFYCPTDRRVYL